MEAQQRQRRIYRRKSVLERLDNPSVSSLYRWMSEGRFPRPFKFGNDRSVAWDADAVDAWIASQLEKATTAEGAT